jgi:lipopolysaccharide transport system ATP-binding protein
MPAIRVENLGKKYRLRHQQEGRRYKALRDVLAAAPKRLWARLSGDATANPSMEDFWALRDVSFEIPQGEAVGIVGRNGAGKSTLLKLLSRITEPTTGRIEVEGRIASLLEVGTGFHPELTGRENIYLNGAILGMSRNEIKRRFDEIVAFAEVERFLDTPVKRYSSGMYMRLAFAVAAHLEPEILVIDEVLAVGDASFQKKCLGRMSQVAGEGRTVLFVSHNMGAVSTLCRSALWLDKGRIVETGPTREVLDHYLTSNAAGNDAVVDLSTSRRIDEYGRRLKITKVEWLSGLPMKHGEKVRIRVHFAVYGDIEDAAVGLVFSTLEGVRLLTYETDFPDLSRPHLPKNLVSSVDLTIDELPLAPGLYSLDAGVRSGDGFGVDYVGNFTQAEIAMGANTPGYIARKDAGVRIAADWQWNFEPTAETSPALIPTASQ